jgi:hypothetical protein
MRGKGEKEKLQVNKKIKPIELSLEQLRMCEINNLARPYKWIKY